MAGHVLQLDDEKQLRALLPWLSTLAHRRALVPSKCGCVAEIARDGCTFRCRQLRSGALVGMHSDELVKWCPVLPVEEDPQSFRPM